MYYFINSIRKTGHSITWGKGHTIYKSAKTKIKIKENKKLLFIIQEQGREGSCDNKIRKY